MTEIHAFGEIPIADILRKTSSTATEPRLPLTLIYCEACSLVQLLESVHPEVIYDENYPYYSMVSSAWMEHCRQSALHLITDLQLDSSSLVLEIASNDGYMLKNFHEVGIPVLGIDPSSGPAARARAAGIPTDDEFFTKEYAATLKKRGVEADLILANNVLAHVPDLTGFVEGVGLLLKPDGRAVFECPSLLELVRHCEFDTIYHQHHCYFSVLALETLFRRAGLWLNHVEAIPTHGGSLRLSVSQRKQQDHTVTSYQQKEKQARLDHRSGYRHFSDQIHSIQSNLVNHLTERKERGERIAIYGAAAKGCTFINTLPFPSDSFEYVVDRNPHKQGQYFTGTSLIIHSPDILATDMPDALLILPWNLRDEIIRQQATYRNRGGQFIIPIPSLEVA